MLLLLLVQLYEKTILPKKIEWLLLPHQDVLFWPYSSSTSLLDRPIHHPLMVHDDNPMVQHRNYYSPSGVPKWLAKDDEHFHRHRHPMIIPHDLRILVQFVNSNTRRLPDCDIYVCMYVCLYVKIDTCTSTKRTRETSEWKNRSNGNVQEEPNQHEK